MENLETGLLLMVVGMTTVFAILLIVIYLGKGLIVLVNKFAPEEITVKQPPRTAIAAQAGAINNQEMAVIATAISIVTGGKGKVVKVEKI